MGLPHIDNCHDYQFITFRTIDSVDDFLRRLFVQDLPNIPLAKLMQLIKGGSAKLINDLLNKRGHFWFKNYYDKGIRDQAHFDCVYRYIENNPLKLGLSQQAMRFYGVYGSD